MPSWDDIQKAMLQSDDQTADDRAAQGFSDLGTLAGNKIAEHLDQQSQQFQAAKDALHQGNYGLSDFAANAGINAAMGTIGSVKAPGAATLEDAATLPMDEASRMARAKDMGFNTGKTYYHGTKADIEGFDPNALGASTNAGSAKEGFFFSDNPRTAELFGYIAPNEAAMENERLYKEYSKILNDRFTNPGFDENTDPDLVRIGKRMDELQKLPRSKRSMDQVNIIPTHLKTENPFVKDMAGREFAPGEMANLMRAAKEKGHDSVIFQNAIDTPHQTERTPSTITAVFDPSQIRSKFANFDPSKAGSGNISAGIAGAALLGGGAAATQGGEAQAQDYDPLARVRNALNEARKQKQENE